MKSKNINFKSSKAITLISLIITIIILIILAGVAISLTLGENGISRKAKQAKRLYSNAEITETSQINKIEEELENIELDLPQIPYKGLGYKFIYDGTLGESGLEGRNMCNEVTGGWSTARTTCHVMVEKIIIGI